ncbi:MAG: NADH-quinone oxidoreductase subunit M, partial [Sulfurospirillaceae bacterium]|nr:NADH-quinone oxidoreductase subunit M [Sulfurospirillaceae bacterium]
MQIGILSIIIFLPMAVAFILLLLPIKQAGTRNIAFVVSLVIFFLALYIYNNFQLTGYMQLREFYPWIQTYGIHYS